jgi:hypothetical protein
MEARATAAEAIARTRDAIMQRDLPAGMCR